MAELNPLDGQTNGGRGGGMGEEAMGTTAKRQRRPSVRLGDIGGDIPLGYDHLHQQHNRRGLSKQQLQMQYQWKQQQQQRMQKGSRAKSNETLVDKNGIGEEGVEGFGNEGGDDEGDLDLDRVAIGSWKSFRDASKLKRGRGGSIRKRVRSNWASSKIDESEKLLTSGGEGEGEREEGFNLGDDEGIGRNFSRENLEDEEEEEGEERNESPIQCFDDNVDVEVDRERGFSKNRRRVTRVSDEMEGPSDSVERNGVKVWLNQLGLGRYAPVFEIHEVDDEVLPMLTLEDLKDMGINAVGSRRKMYCSIQKLNKGFS